MAAERQIGDRIVQQLVRSPDYLDDLPLQDYLQAVWMPLVAAARASGEISPDLDERFAWSPMLLRDSSVNAFALPGGYLGVHTGLLAAVATPDELASVLGHELSHVTQRHISRMVAHQDRQTPWIVAAMILGALAASASRNADVMQAAVAGGQAVAAQTQLNFSRDMEREADRVGYSVMTGAGFDGNGFVTMFDKLQQASRHNDDGAYPYLRSHPLTTERMADMKARLPLDAAAPASLPPAGRPGLQWHALMAARARVLGEPDVQRLRTWSRLRPSGSDSTALATAYTAALAQLRLKDYSSALRNAQTLLAQPGLDAQGRKAVTLLVLETCLVGDLLTAGSPSLGGADAMQPITALAQQALQAPDRASVLLGAQVAIRQGQWRAASERLQTWVALNSKDAAAWGLLAQAWSAQGQTLRAIRAEAESKVASQDLDAAVDRLQAARDMARDMARQGKEADHFELSIIDARWRELTQRQRERALAERR